MEGDRIVAGGRRPAGGDLRFPFQADFTRRLDGPIGKPVLGRRAKYLLCDSGLGWTCWSCISGNVRLVFGWSARPVRKSPAYFNYPRSEEARRMTMSCFTWRPRADHPVQRPPRRFGFMEDRGARGDLDGEPLAETDWVPEPLGNEFDAANAWPPPAAGKKKTSLKAAAARSACRRRGPSAISMSAKALHRSHFVAAPARRVDARNPQRSSPTDHARASRQCDPRPC